MDVFNAKMLQLRKEMDKVKLFQQMEEVTKAPKEYLGLGAIVGCLILLFTGYGAAFISSFVGFAYPAYASLKAVESPKTEDDTQWLIYWLVFSGLSILECFASFLIQYIPFYFVFKIILLVWCMHPKFKGATVIYRQLLSNTRSVQDKPPAPVQVNAHAADKKE